MRQPLVHAPFQPQFRQIGILGQRLFHIAHGQQLRLVEIAGVLQQFRGGTIAMFIGIGDFAHALCKRHVGLRYKLP